MENETNYYCLTFLNDAVRASEDYAGDNHIYLYYERPEDLFRLMLVSDLSALLAQKKFVFLMGRKNKSRYPINFKKQFGLDYRAMEPQPLRVEELNRFCLWYKHAHSGTIFSLGVLDANEHTVVYGGYDTEPFYANSTLHGKRMFVSEAFRAVMRDINRTFTVQALLDISRSEGTKLCMPELDDFLAWLRTVAGEAPCTVAYLFRAYFLFRHQRRHGPCRARIAPVIVFDPHVWDPGVFFPLVESFPHHVVLTCVREPIRTFASCYWRTLVVWNKFQTQFILSHDYTYTTFLSDALKKRYFGFRFEDLKLHPAEVCRGLCRFLNIPFAPEMTRAEAPYHGNDGREVRGFEQTALTRNMDSVFSEFDRLRLQIFYEPIHKYYGYPGFNSEEYPLTAQEMARLFAYPFRFERSYREVYGANAPEEAELHGWIQAVLRLRLSEPERNKMVFPKLIAWEA